MTARVNLPGPRHRGDPGAVFLEELSSAWPGCQAWRRPPCRQPSPLWETAGGPQDLWVQGTPVPRPGEGPAAYGNSVSPDYFRALGLSLREGRVFTAADRQSPERVVIINETMARSLWPGRARSASTSAIPEAIRLGPLNGRRWWGWCPTLVSWRR
jgi:hypothetical protein